MILIINYYLLWDAFTQHPDQITTLQLPQSVQLLWKNGWIIRITQIITENQKKLGLLSVEQPLTIFNQLSNNNFELNRSVKFIICTPHTPKSVHCFPTQLASQTFLLPLEEKKETAKMFHALLGQPGVINMVGHQNKRVLAVYSSIKTLGLGIVAKIDLQEIYYPIRKQFHLLLVVLFLTILAGMFLLYWQILPLIRKVIFSNEQAHKPMSVYKKAKFVYERLLIMLQKALLRSIRRGSLNLSILKYQKFLAMLTMKLWAKILSY